MSDYLPLIIGLEGTSLTSNESNFLINYKPWGIILFQRNCVNHKTTLNLINDIKAKTHQNIPILIDQEGGRVSRLNYREFPKTLSAKSFGDLYEYNKEKALEAVKLNTNLIAGSLKQMGININTVPVLDMPSLTESGVIGDRAYSSNKKIITEIAKIVLDTNSTNGIASVIKHIPGHGRATVDSHVDLPVITDEKDLLERQDFMTFTNLNKAPIAMTAHAIYSGYDEKNVATLSKKIIGKIIRKKIDFNGLLITDDISMKALKGDIADNAFNSLKAGCDIVLHCNGNFDEIMKITNKISEFDLISIDTKLLEIFNTDLKLDLKEVSQKLEAIQSQYS